MEKKKIFIFLIVGMVLGVLAYFSAQPTKGQDDNHMAKMRKAKAAKNKTASQEEKEDTPETDV